MSYQVLKSLLNLPLTGEDYIVRGRFDAPRAARKAADACPDCGAPLSRHEAICLVCMYQR